MDRWSGILRVSLNPNTTTTTSTSFFNVAASLCFSPSSKTLIVPSVNAILFTGDHVEGTGNSVIERLSNTQNIAEILVSKFSKLGASVNAWVIEASTFNGAFAVYKEFIPSLNSWGEPKGYDPDGFPASTSTLSLLSNCFIEVNKVKMGENKLTPQTSVYTSPPHPPKTVIFGFSKGGIILNQLVAELACTKLESSLSYCHVIPDTARGNISEIMEDNKIIPSSKDSFLNSISEIHYVDVGLNSTGAYITDKFVIEKVVNRVNQGAGGIHFVLHGTPRQWRDSRRSWIANEKDKLLKLLEDAAKSTAGKIQVRERLYLANRSPNLQMHFEIIELLEVN